MVLIFSHFFFCLQWPNWAFFVPTSRADFFKEPAFNWLSKMSREAKLAIKNSKVLFCNGYGFDELSPGLLLTVVDCAVEVGTSIFFDPGPRGKNLITGTPEEQRALNHFLRMSDVLLLTADEVSLIAFFILASILFSTVIAYNCLLYMLALYYLWYAGVEVIFSLFSYLWNFSFYLAFELHISVYTCLSHVWPVLHVYLSSFSCSTVKDIIFIYSLFIRTILTLCSVSAISLKYGRLNMFCLFVQVIAYL